MAGELSEHYDVIVVGAGPSGAAVGARLSEDPDLSVLLLDRGPDWRVADAPAEMYAKRWIAYMDLESMAPFHAMDMTARKTADAEDRLYLGGQGIGGSSTINGQATIRPPMDDYDVWAREGATNWSGPMALDLWRRIEADQDFGDRPEHGSEGPLSVERTPAGEWSVLDQAFWSAAGDLGYDTAEDLNDGSAEGRAPIPFSRRDGKRVTANHAYLEPARERENLTIRGNVLVDRILMDASGEKAIGVRAEVDGVWTEVGADQVVVAAGTLGSGAMLMRSGIGPADELARHGIEVLRELPVGRHLQDHLMFTISTNWELPDLTGLGTNWTSCTVRYGSGLCDAPGGDLLLLPYGPVEIFNLAFPPSVAVWLFETYSRGSMSLRSTDPREWPDVCMGMYADDRDLIRMRDGARRAAAILDASAFDGLRDEHRVAGVAGVPLVDLDDDAAVDSMLRETTELHAHVSCSAPMGQEDSEHAVVDPDARVIGVENLWVCDLSICPKVARAGTYPTAMLLGEFVSDRIRARLGSSELVS